MDQLLQTQVKNLLQLATLIFLYWSTGGINDVYDSKKIYCLSSSGCEVLDADRDEAEDDVVWTPVSPSRHPPDSVAVLGSAIYSVSSGGAEVYSPDQGQEYT